MTEYNGINVLAINVRNKSYDFEGAVTIGQLEAVEFANWIAKNAAWDSKLKGWTVVGKRMKPEVFTTEQLYFYEYLKQPK